MNEKVRVVVRIRPLNKVEKRYKNHVDVSAEEDDKNVRIRVQENMYQDFECSMSFGDKTKQSLFFEACGIKGLLHASITGYQTTAFAYGQTGAGKTFSMIGDDTAILAKKFGDFGHHRFDGLLPRSIHYLFNVMEALSNEWKFKVRVSCLEIYQENINDLLVDEKVRKTLQIREHQEYGFFAEGLRVMSCRSSDELMCTIYRALRHRKIASHNTNARSSRSHCIITIFVDSLPKLASDGVCKYGSISFVDLAGSERLKQTGSKAGHVKEAGHINKSLYTLGKVIRGIKANRVVPYRDSKLTKLLIRSLGGNNKTLMIACVSSASGAVSETIRTLKFATGVMGISNFPTVTLNPQEKLINELRLEVLHLRKENEKLRNHIVTAPAKAGGGGGGSGGPELNFYTGKTIAGGNGNENGKPSRSNSFIDMMKDGFGCNNKSSSYTTLSEDDIFGLMGNEQLDEERENEMNNNNINNNNNNNNNNQKRNKNNKNNKSINRKVLHRRNSDNVTTKSKPLNNRNNGMCSKTMTRNFLNRSKNDVIRTKNHQREMQNIKQAEEESGIYKQKELKLQAQLEQLTGGINFDEAVIRNKDNSNNGKNDYVQNTYTDASRSNPEETSFLPEINIDTSKKENSKSFMINNKYDAAIHRKHSWQEKWEENYAIMMNDQEGNDEAVEEEEEEEEQQQQQQQQQQYYNNNYQQHLQPRHVKQSQSVQYLPANNKMKIQYQQKGNKRSNNVFAQARAGERAINYESPYRQNKPRRVIDLGAKNYQNKNYMSKYQHSKLKEMTSMNMKPYQSLQSKYGKGYGTIEYMNEEEAFVKKNTENWMQHHRNRYQGDFVH